jgi:8-oxo-dGTP pyrophosphatase MutT (NUDIX family)
MDPILLINKNLFIESVVRKLRQFPIDFTEKMTLIRSSQGTSEPSSAAGVLLLLYYKKEHPDADDQQGEFYFQLIKRSVNVVQPGDLSCPGGMLHPILDGLLRLLLVGGIVPVLNGYPKSSARQRDENTFKTMMLFLANAIRESWEEIRLSPFNIQFLGPLPCHSLILFRRTIFPLVGLVKKEPSYRTNREVERIVEIPIKSFFRADNYAHYLIETADSIKHSDQTSWQFPCFLHRDEKGGQEILWGATFNIITHFLKILFDFKLPEIRSNPVISRTLQHTYLTGCK